MKVSVVISAFNEEKNIDECLKSVLDIAFEIVIIDSSSTDSTRDIAQKYTDKVFTRENNLMLNVNKNYGFEKATGPWILSIDADERVEPELAQEILELPDSTELSGFYLPRKNIIFGKWIEHTGWYPDSQLRLFKKGKGRFAEVQVHEMLSIEGDVGYLNNPMLHKNYESVSQFLEKMIKVYTVSEADSLISAGYIYNAFDIFKMPISEFVSRFFYQKGYKDGMHGLSLSLLMAFYHLVVFLRLWEKNKFVEQESVMNLFEEGSRFTKKQIVYWAANEKLQVEKNPIKKQIYRIKRKKNSS